MDLHALKLLLIEALLKVEDETLLQKMAHLLKDVDKDFWEHLTPEQQQEIEEGIKEVEPGDQVTYEELMRKLRK